MFSFRKFSLIIILSALCLGQISAVAKTNKPTESSTVITKDSYDDFRVDTTNSNFKRWTTSHSGSAESSWVENRGIKLNMDYQAYNPPNDSYTGGWSNDFDSESELDNWEAIDDNGYINLTAESLYLNRSSGNYFTYHRNLNDTDIFRLQFRSDMRMNGGDGIIEVKVFADDNSTELIDAYVEFISATDVDIYFRLSDGTNNQYLVADTYSRTTKKDFTLYSIEFNSTHFLTYFNSTLIDTTSKPAWWSTSTTMSYIEAYADDSFSPYADYLGYDFISWNGTLSYSSRKVSLQRSLDSINSFSLDYEITSFSSVNTTTKLFFNLSTNSVVFFSYYRINSSYYLYLNNHTYSFFASNLTGFFHFSFELTIDATKITVSHLNSSSYWLRNLALINQYKATLSCSLVQSLDLDAAVVYLRHVTADFSAAGYSYYTVGTLDDNDPVVETLTATNCRLSGDYYDSELVVGYRYLVQDFYGSTAKVHIKTGHENSLASIRFMLTFIDENGNLDTSYYGSEADTLCYGEVNAEYIIGWNNDIGFSSIDTTTPYQTTSDITLQRVIGGEAAFGFSYLNDSYGQVGFNTYNYDDEGEFMKETVNYYFEFSSDYVKYHWVAITVLFDVQQWHSSESDTADLNLVTLDVQHQPNENILIPDISSPKLRAEPVKPTGLLAPLLAPLIWLFSLFGAIAGALLGIGAGIVSGILSLAIWGGIKLLELAWDIYDFLVRIVFDLFPITEDLWELIVDFVQTIIDVLTDVVPLIPTVSAVVTGILSFIQENYLPYVNFWVQHLTNNPDKGMFDVGLILGVVWIGCFAYESVVREELDSNQDGMILLGYANQRFMSIFGWLFKIVELILKLFVAILSTILNFIGGIIP